MDGTARAPQHDAPPPARPLSGGAVTALVLSLLFVPVAFVAAWWVEILPLAVGAASWWAIAEGRRRGRGVAIAACVLALLAGTGALLVHGWLRGRFFQPRLESFMEALAKDDRAELTAWVSRGEEPAPTVARWRERMVAVEREAGAYGHRAEVDWGLWGPLVGMIARPREDLVEVGAPEGTSEPPRAALWFRATFARERLWVALVGGREEAPVDAEALRSSRTGMPLVHDVRFFRARGGS